MNSIKEIPIAEEGFLDIGDKMIIKENHVEILNDSKEKKEDSKIKITVLND